MKENLSKEALDARREYQRIWRSKNKDKTKANNVRYWERVAAKKAAAERGGGAKK